MSVASINCVHCSTALDADATTCPSCRKDPRRTTKDCTYCGKAIPSQSLTCPQCHQRTALDASHYCTMCGAVGYPKHFSGGSFFVAGLIGVAALVLTPLIWIGFLLYVVFWVFSSYTGCASCNAKAVIPVESPIAQAAIAKLRQGDR